MSEEVLELYNNYFKQATEEIAMELLEMELGLEKEVTTEYIDKSERILTVIIGISGEYKGRALLEISEKVARVITEKMNFGPLEEENDLYLYMGEFGNMISGRAITFLNNLNKDKIVRLTPPAVFSANNLVLSTPNIQSSDLFFKSESIKLKLNIGFEGV